MCTLLNLKYVPQLSVSKHCNRWVLMILNHGEAKTAGTRLKTMVRGSDVQTKKSTGQRKENGREISVWENPGSKHFVKER